MTFVKEIRDLSVVTELGPNFAPEKASKSIARSKLTFDERVLLHRVAGEQGAGCQANMAHIRQSRPDSGLDSLVKVVALAF